MRNSVIANTKFTIQLGFFGGGQNLCPRISAVAKCDSTAKELTAAPGFWDQFYIGPGIDWNSGGVGHKL